jgi:hypothetical protein
MFSEEEEEQWEPAYVGIQLCPNEREVAGVITRTLQWLRRNQHTPMVVGYEGRDRIFDKLSTVTARPRKDFMYLFMNMRHLTAHCARALEQVNVVLFQEEAVHALRAVRASRVFLILMASLMPKLARSTPQGYEDVFTFRQRPGFDRLLPLGRNDMVLLGERLSWEGDLPYPDTRTLEPQHRKELIAAIREWGELEACPHCGSIWPHGITPGLCCSGKEAEVVGQLPPAMPRDLLDRVLAQMAGNANFARWLNQHMRPVMHNASMRCPCGPAPTSFVSGMP